MFEASSKKEICLNFNKYMFEFVEIVKITMIHCIGNIKVQTRTDFEISTKSQCVHPNIS